MKLSELDPNSLSELTHAQVTDIVFGVIGDDGLSGIAAVLLGGRPLVLRERAQAAAKLYHDGCVPCIIPTGGVKWETERGVCSEAEYMAHWPFIRMYTYDMIFNYTFDSSESKQLFETDVVSIIQSFTLH